MTQEKLIYRVTGCDLRHIQPYAIIPYVFIKEHEKTFEVLPTIEPKGANLNRQRNTFQPKRTTSNSEWFKYLPYAQENLLVKIRHATQSIQESFEQLRNTSFTSIPITSRLYYAKFKKEIFSLQCFHIEKEKEDSWYVKRNMRTITAKEGHYFREKETGEKIQKKEIPAGRAYFYKRQSLPHNAKKPVESWVMRDLDTLKAIVEQYAENRIKYLLKRSSLYADYVPYAIGGNDKEKLLELLQ